MFEFKYPFFLLLLLPIAGLIILSIKRKKPSVSIPSLRPFIRASAGSGFNLFSEIPFILFCASLVLLTIALARPRKGIEEIKQRTEGIDIIIAIDLSGSMQAIDIPEKYKSERQLANAINDGTLKNRLDTAKEEIKKFIEKRPNDRIGLIAFAPLPYSVCPPTLDHAWLFAHIDRLEPGMIGDSTGIAGPIASAVNRLKDSEAKRKIIVMFTDGMNNVNAKITPMQAAKLAKQYGIRIYTVGIGSPNAIIKQKDFFGRTAYVPVQFEFDEKLLKDMASETGGQYYTARDAEGLEKTMNEINKLEKTTMEQPRSVDYKELAFPLVYAGLALLLAGIVLGNTLILKIP
ncbi:MAG: VWA domain-containing protein [Candidatus Nanoarchaeia archaeon]